MMVPQARTLNQHVGLARLFRPHENPCHDACQQAATGRAVGYLAAFTPWATAPLGVGLALFVRMLFGYVETLQWQKRIEKDIGRYFDETYPRDEWLIRILRINNGDPAHPSSVVCDCFSDDDQWSSCWETMEMKKYRNYLPEQILALPEKVRHSDVPMGIYHGSDRRELGVGTSLLRGKPQCAHVPRLG